MPDSKKLPDSLPAGSAVESIAYVSADSNLPHELVKFPAALQTKAVSLNGAADSHPTDVSLLTVPAAGLQSEATLASVRDWVGDPNNNGDAASLLMSLQNVQVMWSPERIAVIAESDRLQTVRAAMVEVNHYIAELAAIEAEIDSMWPHYEADLAAAFDYDDKTAHRRKELSQRFQQTYKLRARLARITPLLLTPHKYPPTLASQVGERLRERVHVEDRVEYVSDKIEVFEELYEMCNQRANDHQHAKSGNTLEWVIIVLLIFQLLVAVFDYITFAGG